MAPRNAVSPLRYEGNVIVDAGGFVVANRPSGLEGTFSHVGKDENMRELVRRWNGFEHQQQVMADLIEEKGQVPVFQFWLEWFPEGNEDPTVYEEGNVQALDPDQAVEFVVEHIRKGTSRSIREHRDHSLLYVVRLRANGLGVMNWDWDDDVRQIDLGAIHW